MPNRVDKMDGVNGQFVSNNCLITGFIHICVYAGKVRKWLLVGSMLRCNAYLLKFTTTDNTLLVVVGQKNLVLFAKLKTYTIES